MTLNLFFQHKLFIVLLIVALFFYSFRLDLVPVHLNQDELGFALNADSISKTGMDENGRFFPVYFWHLGIMYSTPVIVYLSSFFLLFLPLSEVTIRLSSVFVGMVDLVLIYLIANKIFRKQRYGIVAAFFLAITPPHLIQSRILLDNLYPVPFTLSWLLFLLLFFESKKLRYLFVATLFLGIGVHSYHSAKIMMAIYLFFTLVTCFRDIIRNKSILIIIFLGFLIAQVPLYIWLQKYPDTLIDQVKYTKLYDPSLNLFQGILSLFTPESLLKRFLAYCLYFDPNFLFSKGDVSLTHSTFKTGIFLYSYIILLPLGILAILKYFRNKIGFLIFAGFVTAPAAAAIITELYMSSRVDVMVAFGALIATYGIFLLMKSNKIKWLSYFLIIVSLMQFIYFYLDYITDYKVRSYSMFHYNTADAFDSVMNFSNNQQNSKIYISNQIDFRDRYFRFYAIKNNRKDLINRLDSFGPDEIGKIPKYSLLMFRFDAIGDSLVNNQIRLIDQIKEPDGKTSFYIFKKI